jgi:hypothetical protein
MSPLVVVNFRIFTENHRILMHNFLKVSPPFDLSQNQMVSPECRKDTELYIKSMQNYELWALQSKWIFQFENFKCPKNLSFLVHDSSAKLPSGILNGNLNQYGDFDQCLGIRSPDKSFQGKYCLAFLQPSIEGNDEILESYRKITQANDVIKSKFEDVSIVV